MTSTHNDIDIVLRGSHAYGKCSYGHRPPASFSAWTAYTLFASECGTQFELQVDSIALPVDISPKVLGLTLSPRLTYSRHKEVTAAKARRAMRILNALKSTVWGSKGKRSSQHARPFITHARVRFHCVVTADVGHKRQQATDGTGRCWVHNRQKHSVSVRQDTHTTHNGTTHITDKTKINTPHAHYTTSQHRKQLSDVRSMRQHRLHRRH